MTEAMPAATASTVTSAFGTHPAPSMVVAETTGGSFGRPRSTSVAPLEIHPFAHALHYGSSCFEGLKAHRGPDGVVRLFRADRHAARLSASARALRLPDPGDELVLAMIERVVADNLASVPEPPGALYVRPVLLGVDPNIGAAASPSEEALLFVVASPVGDYFAGGSRPLSLLVETSLPRTTPQFGRVKTGANYAMALDPTLRARSRYDVDQVLFAPGGDVQETGAANFLLLDGSRVVTKPVDGSFLEGVTRDAVLQLAADLGLRVEERDIAVDELVAWCRDGEAALAGTAAVLSGVGELVVDGERHRVGDGYVGPTTSRLRELLVAVQQGRARDRHGWTRPVG